MADVGVDAWVEQKQPVVSRAAHQDAVGTRQMRYRALWSRYGWAQLGRPGPDAEQGTADADPDRPGADGHPAPPAGVSAEVDWLCAAAQERIVAGRPPKPVPLRRYPVDVAEPDRLSQRPGIGQPPGAAGTAVQRPNGVRAGRGRKLPAERVAQLDAAGARVE